MECRRAVRPRFDRRRVPGGLRVSERNCRLESLSSSHRPVLVAGWQETSFVGLWQPHAGMLYLWDTSSRQLTELARDLNMTAVACSFDMRQVAVGKGDGSIAVWQCDTLEKGLLSNSRLIPGHSDRAEPAGFSPDGTRLLVVSARSAGKVLGRLYSTGSDQCLDEWQEEGWNTVTWETPPLVDWAGDGSCFSYGFDNTMTIRSPDGVVRTPDVHYYPRAAWSHDGKTVAVCGEKAVVLIDRHTQKVTRKISDVPERGLAWSPDDKTLAVSCAGSKVKLVPMDEKTAVRLLESPPLPFAWNNDMSWSPDGKTLAVIQHGALILFDVASGKGRILARGVARDRDLLCWLDAGKKLAAYNESTPDDGVAVWDVATGKILRSFSTDGERSISFAPRKGLFAVGGPARSACEAWPTARCSARWSIFATSGN